MIIRYYSSSVFMGHGEPSYGGDENACCGVGQLNVRRWPSQRAALANSTCCVLRTSSLA